MGTNYYIEYNTCQECKRCDTLHLGKASIGWAFLFQATDDIENYDDWKEAVRKADRIYDENGRVLTADEMISMVQTRRSYKNPKVFEDYYYDQYGNVFAKGDFT